MKKLRAEQTVNPQTYPDAQMESGGMQQGLLLVDLIALELMRAHAGPRPTSGISAPATNRVDIKDVHNYYRMAEAWIDGRNAYFD